MKKVLFSVLLLTLSINLYSNDKIVGGEEVKNFDEASYVVTYGGCAGSIISNKWILTAAHCKSLFQRDMYAGSLVLDDNTLKLEVDQTFVHPRFGTQGLSFDFALIKLRDVIDLKKYKIKPITMASKKHESRGIQKPGTIATVYGWGLMNEGGLFSGILRKVEVPIITNELANAPESYNGIVSDSMIAAGYPEGGKDACQGDSGGPMVTTVTNGKKYLVGVVSWGVGCARAMKYGIYSKVSSAQDWINETIKNN